MLANDFSDLSGSTYDDYLGDDSYEDDDLMPELRFKKYVELKKEFKNELSCFSRLGSISDIIYDYLLLDLDAEQLQSYTYNDWYNLLLYVYEEEVLYYFEKEQLFFKYSTKKKIKYENIRRSNFMFATA